ncbi:TyrR/PhhR family helix-turn-helix DNA-binding protein [Priestia megaterium]|jgi:TyrR family helix-turn-helix protein
MSLKEAKRQVEKELILKAYGEYKSTYKVAEVLQVDQSTISKKLKVYKKEGF